MEFLLLYVIIGGIIYSSIQSDDVPPDHVLNDPTLHWDKRTRSMRTYREMYSDRCKRDAARKS